MSNPGTSANSSYGRRRQQIGKQDLYMLTALWMEKFPCRDKEITGLRVVGAVFVTPNDRVLSVDRSRGNDGGVVHGAIRALLQYPDQVQGCYVYLSRQPCAHCVKMLVQAAVKKVFYLPFEPEKDDEKENNSVDALFKVSPVSREVYVPNITDGDTDELKSANEKNPYGTRTEESVAPKEEWEKWKDEKLEDKIGWTEYSDPNIKEQVNDNMRCFLDWYRMGILETGWENPMRWEKDSSNKLEDDVASHLSRLAQMLSHRTDDPSTGIGCVIADQKKEEIVGIGWNGYPSEALYGNHPRGSKTDRESSQKYPHIIYALENAVLFRNRRELDGCDVYHTIVPSDEGIAMLYQLCPKPVLVLPSFDSRNDEEMEKKRLFKNGLQEKKLTVVKHSSDQNPAEGNPEDAGSG